MSAKQIASLVLTAAVLLALAACSSGQAGGAADRGADGGLDRRESPRRGGGEGGEQPGAVRVVGEGGGVTGSHGVCSRKAFIWRRAALTRDLTVPTGTRRTSAASW